MLADLNGHLLVPGGNGRFIALAFSVYDPGQHSLTVANAGFPPPLLVRDRMAVAIDVGGVPLGLLPESTYESVRVQLEPGDMVVFCSDGIHEQTNPLEEEFGVERLLSQLAETGDCATAGRVAENIARSIEEHAGRRAGGCQFVDDRTIVILRVTDANSSC
jgi:sigma-B regulation protein RsbU (phosphoserine phosphatase)